MAELDGVQLGSCRLLHLLTSDGIGERYLAEQPESGRRVIVRVFHWGERAASRFATEARLLTMLEHPNILPVYESGVVDRLSYLVTPYSDDSSLADLFTPPAGRLPLPLDPRMVVSIVSQLAEALQFAHEHNVIHGDVRPGNVLAHVLSTASTLSTPPFPQATFSSPADTPTRLYLLLANFALARIVAELTGGPATDAPPYYTAPEQFTGRATPASDQYALACVAYHLLTGRTPFTGTFAELQQQHGAAMPLLPSQVNQLLPAGVDGPLLRALAKDPQQRFAQIDEFAIVFQAALAGTAPEKRVVALPDGSGSANSQPALRFPAQRTPAPTPEIRPGGAVSPVAQTAQSTSSDAPPAALPGQWPWARRNRKMPSQSSAAELRRSVLPDGQPSPLPGTGPTIQGAIQSAMPSSVPPLTTQDAQADHAPAPLPGGLPRNVRMLAHKPNRHRRLWLAAISAALVALVILSALGYQIVSHLAGRPSTLAIVWPQNMRAVTMLPDGEGWAVGDSTILHYEHGLWTTQATIQGFFPTSIFALSDQEAWAAGNGIYHYSNGQWREQRVTDSHGQAIDFTNPNEEIISIRLLTATDGWAIGTNRIFAYHNGSWVQQTLPPSPNNVTKQVDEAGNVYYVTDPYIVTVSGRQFAFSPCLDAAGANSIENCLQVNDIALATSSEGWVVGASSCRAAYSLDLQQQILYEQPGQLRLCPLLHYTHGKWQLAFAQSTIPQINLFSAEMASTSEGWAVGDESNPNGVGPRGDIPIIFHYAVGQWRQWTQPIRWLNNASSASNANMGTLLSIATLPDGEAWVAGNNGIILHYTGESWVQQASPTDEMLNAIAMVSARDGWIVGTGGTVLHYDGQRWSKVA